MEDLITRGVKLGNLFIGELPAKGARVLKGLIGILGTGNRQ